MGKSQDDFLAMFQRAFRERTGRAVLWTGGQAIPNTAGLPLDTSLRRGGQVRNGERFELGDITASVGIWRVVVEFESKEVPLSNLLKYWPYIRGELSTQPIAPLLICHFSDWWSYASRRDLWKWTLTQMKVDARRVVDVEGKQFDHWGGDVPRRAQAVDEAISWVESVVSGKPTGRIEPGGDVANAA